MNDSNKIRKKNSERRTTGTHLICVNNADGSNEQGRGERGEGRWERGEGLVLFIKATEKGEHTPSLRQRVSETILSAAGIRNSKCAGLCPVSNARPP